MNHSLCVGCPKECSDGRAKGVSQGVRRCGLREGRYGGGTGPVSSQTKQEVSQTIRWTAVLLIRDPSCTVLSLLAPEKKSLECTPTPSTTRCCTVPLMARRVSWLDGHDTNNASAGLAHRRETAELICQIDELLGRNTSSTPQIARTPPTIPPAHRAGMQPAPQPLLPTTPVQIDLGQQHNSQPRSAFKVSTVRPLSTVSRQCEQPSPRQPASPSPGLPSPPPSQPLPAQLQPSPSPQVQSAPYSPSLSPSQRPPADSPQRQPALSTPLIPLSFAAHGASSANRCVAFGEAFEYAYVHRTATFTIQARDAQGENCRVGGDAFAVKVRPRKLCNWRARTPPAFWLRPGLNAPMARLGARTMHIWLATIARIRSTAHTYPLNWVRWRLVCTAFPSLRCPFARRCS